MMWYLRSWCRIDIVSWVLGFWTLAFWALALWTLALWTLALWVLALWALALRFLALIVASIARINLKILEAYKLKKNQFFFYLPLRLPTEDFDGIGTISQGLDR